MVEVLGARMVAHMAAVMTAVMTAMAAEEAAREEDVADFQRLQETEGLHRVSLTEMVAA